MCSPLYVLKLFIKFVLLFHMPQLLVIEAVIPLYLWRT